MQPNVVDGAPAVEPLLPLAVGYTWHFTSTSTDCGDPVSTCTDTETVTGKMTIDGRDAFVLTHTFVCPTLTQTSTFYTAVLGDDRYESRSSDATDGIWYLQDSPSEGHQYASDPQGMFVYTWHHVSPVTVPAGTFDDCWREVTTPGGSDQEFTQCRGVGSVKTDQSFTTGCTIHSELVAKSF